MLDTRLLSGRVLSKRERGRMPSWYISECGSAGNLASEAGLGQAQKVTSGSPGNLASEAELGLAQKATLGCVVSSGESDRVSPLLSSEAESSASADIGGVSLTTSDESQSAVPKLRPSARVNGERAFRTESANSARRVVPNTMGRRAIPVESREGAALK